MAITDKRLLCFVAIFCTIIASIHATESRNLRASGLPSNPLSQLYYRLDQLNWDPVRINTAVRQYWDTDYSFLAYKLNSQGKNITTLSTSCHHTAPWFVVAMLQLQTRSYKYPGAYFLPKNKDLIIYNNVLKPYLQSPKSAIQSIRNFIGSRPSSESIVIQVDLLESINLPPNVFSDHHFIIHSYGGKINVYQSWINLFTLTDWMTDTASFSSRYPMAKDTFLNHFETMLTSATTEAKRIKREESTWAILGRTGTKTWKTTNGKKVIDDVVVKKLRDTWLVSLLTHWPNK